MRCHLLGLRMPSSPTVFVVDSLLACVDRADWSICNVVVVWVRHAHLLSAGRGPVQLDTTWQSPLAAVNFHAQQPRTMRLRRSACSCAGSVCGSQLTNKEASVACAQLGYKGGGCSILSRDVAASLPLDRRAVHFRGKRVGVRQLLHCKHGSDDGKLRRMHEKGDAVAQAPG